MTSPKLCLRHRESVLLGECGYDWVDVKQFSFTPPNAATEALLSALLADPAYRDHYAAPAEHDQGEHTLHGPYRVEAITAASFHECAVDEPIQTIRQFARRDATEREAEARVAKVDAKIEPLLRGATRALRLLELDESGQHDWGWVIDDFTEFVVIDDATADLLLVVAGED
jgi:hypothetical protein